MMSKSFMILLAVVVSVSAQNYQYSALLDPDGDFYIRWNVRPNDIQMRIEAFGKGWLSLLLPSSDGSYGDLWVGGFDDTTAQGYLMDYRVNLTSTGGHTTPPELDASQDLTLESASYNPDTAFTFVNLIRKLNTGDARDDVAIESGVELLLGWSFHNTSDSTADDHTDAGFTSITLVPAKN